MRASLGLFFFQSFDFGGQLGQLSLLFVAELAAGGSGRGCCCRDGCGRSCWCRSTSQRSQAIRAQAAQRSGSTPAAEVAPVTNTAAPAAAARSKLSYKEQRELAELPAKIEALEKEQAEARAQLADGSIYQRDPGLAQKLFKRDSEIDEVLLAALERWEILSAR